MIRFILHSILILVVTQLSNVAMGLFASESQRIVVAHQLSQLNDSISSHKDYDYGYAGLNPIIRNPLVSMTRTELPVKVRVMLEGILKEHHACQTVCRGTRHVQAHGVWIPRTERYFHELCLLTI